MRYSVIWSAAAEHELAVLWLNSSDRERLARAADQLDQELRRDALHAGESREEDFRIAIAPPIAIQFRVNEDLRMAAVVHVWQISASR